MAARRPAGSRARAAAVALPRPRGRLPATRLAPSARSIAAGCILVAVAAGAYALARQTSLFAVTRIEVRGARGPAATAVARAVAGWEGTSLVALDGAALVARVEEVPWVASASFDRAFPHTLRVAVRPEHPVAVLRRGRDSWLVSARGRVLVRLRPRTQLELPRIWVPSATAVEAGERLPGEDGGAAARALAPLLRERFPARVATVELRHGALVFALRDGVQVRFGPPDDLRLKLAIARRIVAALPPGTAYLDVSVPERPVAGPVVAAPANTQVSG